jgi:pimeloyl-ACP methyl ester carboxylesterase
VWGELDPVTPYHLAPRVAHDLDAELVTLPGVGHFVHEEDPLAFARAIIDLAGPGAHADKARAVQGEAG